MTGRVEPVDDDLFGAPIHLEDNIESAAAGLDVAIAVGNGETDPTYAALTALVDRMRDDDRLHRVEQVMQLSPWSARTTQRVFRRYVGVPVKWVLCRYRLQQAASAGTTRRTAVSPGRSVRACGDHPRRLPHRRRWDPARGLRRSHRSAG